jgi:CheY-like chemotaxis protein
MGKKWGRRRILLIDDNRQGLLARRIILEDLGYDVETAETGEAGLACFRARASDAPFSLVITDYRMPGMRGDEVIAQLRQLAPAVPLVMLSGYAGPLALTPDSTGADVVLAKGPREQFDLAETVVRLLPDGVRRRGKPPALERNPAGGKRSPARRRQRAG